MASKKFTLTEALTHLLRGHQHRVMGENAVIIGNPQKYARFSLSSCVSGQFSRLTIDIFIDSHKVDSYNLNLCAVRYAPVPWTHKTLKAGETGYYWNYDREFYGTEPEIVPLKEDINNILKFFEIVHKP